MGVTEKEIKPINSGCILINLTVVATFFKLSKGESRFENTKIRLMLSSNVRRGEKLDGKS